MNRPSKRPPRNRWISSAKSQIGSVHLQIHRAFDTFAQHLRRTPPENIPNQPITPEEQEIMFKLEAFCSNNSEGSTVPPQDSAKVMRRHYSKTNKRQIIDDQRDLANLIDLLHFPELRNPSPDQFLDWAAIMRERHGFIFRHRDESSFLPSVYKTRPNTASDVLFAEPQQVIQMLENIFHIGQTLDSGMARGAFYHFGIVMAHPFGDGNGRSARLATNAELITHGQQPCITTHKYRAKMIQAQNRLMHHDDPSFIIPCWQEQQRWTAALSYPTYEEALEDLHRNGHIRENQTQEQNVSIDMQM